jgi:hypothetical protein
MRACSITGSQRNGEGTGRPPDARATATARTAPIDRGQLRRHPLRAHRKRIVRTRKRRSFTSAVRNSISASSSRPTEAPSFLDEIGDMSLSAQAKVLRALQEKPHHPGGRRQGHPGGCARHCRYQQRPAGTEIEKGRLPRRPLPPPQRHSDPRALAQRAPRRYPPADPLFYRNSIRRNGAPPKRSKKPP